MCLPITVGRRRPCCSGLPPFHPLGLGHGDEHRQGIQRLNRDGKNYLLVSNSVGYPDIPGFEVSSHWFSRGNP